MARYLLDTNIVLRVVNEADAEHQLVLSPIAALLANGDTLVVAPQVLVEFWSVATRPANVNGLGWEPSLVADELNQLIDDHDLLDETAEIFQKWLGLVSSLAIRGKRVHDVRLAALMQVNGIERVLTLNIQDFASLPGIIAVHPRDVAGSA